MTFLPNKFIRYCASLRNYIHNSILKNGIKSHHLKKLKQINICEALVNQSNPKPCNLTGMLSNIFLAVKLIKNEKNTDFNYTIENEINCIINIKIFVLLVLNISSYSNTINIYTKGGNIIIKSNGKNNKHSRLLANKLDGCVYNEIKTNNALTVIPYNATDKNKCIRNYKSLNDYISDPLSLVNIFIH